MVSRILVVLALICSVLALFGAGVGGLNPVRELAVAGIALSVAFLL